MSGWRTRARRIVALGIVCVLAAPGTWWRQPVKPQDFRDIFSHRPVAVAQPRGWPESLRLVGMWELDSPNSVFGGYSALLALPGNRLVAYGDRGVTFTFSPPGEESTPPEIRLIPADRTVGWNVDFESATRDSHTGYRWIANETANVITRLSANGTPLKGLQPPEMSEWPRNSGAEAMVRLADGRFILLGEREGPGSITAGPGLLFDGDPVDGAKAIRFRFEPPNGLMPTDMAALPDGRVLILLRGLGLGWPPFTAELVIADPNTIKDGEAWPWEPLAEISPPLPRENYEGLAVAPRADGSADVWIISDDNYANFQRTFLIRLHLSPDNAHDKGRDGKPDAP